TTTNPKNAKLLIQKVFKKGLTSCVHQEMIKSNYIWKNKRVREKEILLSFKINPKDFKKTKKLILKWHSYDIPEIIGIKVHKVSKSYKQWHKNALKA
ncbi:MAG: divalent-cation tolerance protein CutA, partial [Helicobacter sp.]|nr:divalent-cation tolerance protein CutA [Helicobacter sp.]